MPLCFRHTLLSWRRFFYALFITRLNVLKSERLEAFTFLLFDPHDQHTEDPLGQRVAMRGRPKD